jgi:eukaryotic-like serine/threonine-protein kinase
MAATPPSHLVPELPGVVDFIMARALKKNPDERYQSAADFARDLRAALPEVEAGQALARERADAQTVPQQGPSASATTEPRTIPLRDEMLQLRPSPRFESGAGLARLAVPPPDAPGMSATQAAPMPARRRRLPLSRILLAVAYVVAFMAAVMIAFG